MSSQDPLRLTLMPIFWRWSKRGLTEQCFYRRELAVLLTTVQTVRLLEAICLDELV